MPETLDPGWLTSELPAAVQRVDSLMERLDAARTTSRTLELHHQLRGRPLSPFPHERTSEQLDLAAEVFRGWGSGSGPVPQWAAAQLARDSGSRADKRNAIATANQLREAAEAEYAAVQPHLGAWVQAVETETAEHTAWRNNPQPPKTEPPRLGKW